MNPSGKTMLAARVYGPNDLRIETVPVPDLADEESMLVNIRCCAICNGSDRLQMKDHKDMGKPRSLGHEASGDVVRLGSKVEGFSIGDRVTFYVAGGSFAEYNCIRPKQLAMGKLPQGVTYEQGAVIQLLCAVLRGIESAKVGKGDKVLVLGQGPVGLLATQCALARGAELVAVTDTHANRLALSRRLGARVTVNAREEDFVKRIRKDIGEVSVVFDAMGDDLAPKKDTMARSMELMARQGRYVIFGLANEFRCFSPRVVYGRHINIITGHVPLAQSQRLMEQACQWVADGTIDVTSFITHRFPLKDLPKALDILFNNPQDAVKIIVRIPD